MTLPTFVHDDAGSLSAGASVELAGDEGRHAVVVRRLRAGERIVLTDGLGAAATCTVREVDKASLTADVDKVTHQPAEEPLVTVVQAIPKGERGELADKLEETGYEGLAAELGVEAPVDEQVDATADPFADPGF